MLTEETDCPIRNGLLILNGKWNTRVLYELVVKSPMRFNELGKSNSWYF